MFCVQPLGELAKPPDPPCVLPMASHLRAGTADGGTTAVSRIRRGTGALVVDLGEVLVEFGVTELVDRARLAQNFGAGGRFQAAR
jgi:hypothetical protein